MSPSAARSRYAVMAQWGVTVTGPVGGELLIQGEISASGYRSTTRPADVSDLDADDLLQGGPALAIFG